MRLVVTFPHSLGAPGGGTHDCLQLVRHLGRAGAEVIVVPVASLGPTRFPRPRPPAPYSGEAQAAELAQEGILVRPVDRHPLHYLLDGRPVARALADLLVEREVDAVLGWWNETLFLPRLLRERGVLLAMNAAASYGPLLDGPGARGPLRRLRNRLFFTGPLRGAGAVFARSEFTRHELIELGGVDPARIHVSHLGIEPEFAAVERDDDGPITRILFSGTLVHEKGLFDALEALGALHSREWTFRIAGWGDAERVRRAAEEQGIADRIELVGGLDRPGMLAALAWAQLVLHPSWTESFGLANAEAQASGLAVVAYDVAAVPEVVADGETGWLVPLRRPDLLAEALEAALRDPEETRRRGAAARTRAARLFTWSRTAEVTLAGLARALGRS